MTWIETFLGGFAGSLFLLGLLIISVLVILLLILRVSKVVFLGVMFVGVYALAESGFIPMWIFGILIILVGLFIGKTILDGFFSSR